MEITNVIVHRHLCVSRKYGLDIQCTMYMPHAMVLHHFYRVKLVSMLCQRESTASKMNLMQIAIRVQFSRCHCVDTSLQCKLMHTIRTDENRKWKDKEKFSIRIRRAKVKLTNVGGLVWHEKKKISQKC